MRRVEVYDDQDHMVYVHHEYVTLREGDTYTFTLKVEKIPT